MRRLTTEILVLGAGLTGSCTAMELARRGFEVVLVDRESQALNRASLRNEGKIHLGLIYANDPTMATAHLQLKGALRFRSLLHRWLGASVDTIRTSTPFDYLVARDSVLSPAELSAHYEKVEQLYRAERSSDPALDYLGSRPERLWRALSAEAWSPAFRASSFAAGFRTAERAIDTADLAVHVREALARQPRIAFLPNHTVEDVRDTGNNIEASGRHGADRWSITAAQVVNATWEHRLKFDRQMGLPMPPGWLLRLKYRIIARLPPALRGSPSATIVTGRYGDAVIRPDGTAYLSWYPVGLQGWSHEPEPPPAWDGPSRGDVPPALRADLAERTLNAIDAWFPGVRDCQPLLVDAGAIVASGHTDVDDRASRLHDRSRIGVTSTARYHSVDPGKLTTAPFFADLAADRVATALAPLP